MPPMLRYLLVFLLSSSVHGFIIAPTLRLLRSVPRYGCSSKDSRHYQSLGAGRRWRPKGASLTMRRRRDADGDDMRIAGAGGATHGAKRSRRLDLRSLENLGVKAAAAVTTGAAGVDLSEDFWGDKREDAGESQMSREEAMQALKDRLASQQQGADGDSELIDQMSRELEEDLEMDEEDEIENYYDKHTQIYLPVDGVMIKKSYGFWTWQLFGLLFTQHFIRSLIRKGFSLKKVAMAEINWDHVVTEPEHLKELKAYCCDNCGYTLFPARGRHEHFFDDVDDFKCPECEAPRSAFYDANDPEDPHNQVDDEEDEDVDLVPAGGATETTATMGTAADERGLVDAKMVTDNTSVTPLRSQGPKTEGQENTEQLDDADDDDDDYDLLA